MDTAGKGKRTTSKKDAEKLQCDAKNSMESGGAAGGGNGGHPNQNVNPGQEGSHQRLSKKQLYTLLSLWMEVFPNTETSDDPKKSDEIKINTVGLVVVENSKIIGLHRSSKNVHAGQVAILKHALRLQGCELYFSRKPCSTCLKMIINAGVKSVFYWPVDPEVSLCGQNTVKAEDDANAVEKLTSNSHTRVQILLLPVSDELQNFISNTSMRSIFRRKVGEQIEGEHNLRENFERLFLIADEQDHKSILGKIGLETIVSDHCFTILKSAMKKLIYLLADISSSVPELPNWGFYPTSSNNESSSTHQRDVARHCMVQAELLSYRTEDPKTKVGAVIWAKGKSHCAGTGNMYLVGCSYNGFVIGSEFADFPRTVTAKQRSAVNKYKYIIHAEQNALYFRSQDIKVEDEPMLFTTKCPCNDCVFLIQAAGIKEIYTDNSDAGSVQGEISFTEFPKLNDIKKYTWQRYDG
ncbi:cytidine and dCMP deaminase domain-containing protein 1-like [Protopterus annectens]|uniref:cytidine and dCMP deaminase domain-containing protein 1-like n=1 Tax=Protopterus annectens TaxID=7888 RepID=UPI001CFBD340|nr:cytidine and dCMP deaminase domain-containing protein 1-like [Protopterus annectens]